MFGLPHFSSQLSIITINCNVFPIGDSDRVHVTHRTHIITHITEQPVTYHQIHGGIPVPCHTTTTTTTSTEILEVDEIDNNNTS